MRLFGGGEGKEKIHFLSTWPMKSTADFLIVLRMR